MCCSALAGYGTAMARRSVNPIAVIDQAWFSRREARTFISV